MRKSIDRPVVYWGIGEICKNCLRHHPEVNPLFFIDSFSSLSEMDGKKVVKPDDINEWKKYYIVIAVDESVSIKKYLMEIGLEDGEDFSCYRPFFGLEYANPDEDELKIKKIKNDLMGDKKTLLMILCAFVGRQSVQLQKFFNSYISEHCDEYNIIVSANLGSLDEKNASEIMGCTVLDMPMIISDTKSFQKYREYITDEENIYIDQILFRKKYNLSESKKIREINKFIRYKYYIDMINPDKVLCWGSWGSDIYYVQYLCKKNNIQYRVMEHGSIPGTVMIDPQGIMGQSVYGKSNSILKSLNPTRDYFEKYVRIRDYVTYHQLDTRFFKTTKQDEEQLSRLDKSKKTVFLVGMDEAGMSINSNSEYWNEYVSGTYSSMDEALNHIFDICKKKNLNMIYKPHPGNHITDKSLISDGLVYVEEMSVDKLILESDVVLSMSSAVEFKALMYKKALIQIGYSSLWGKNCTYCLENMENLETILDEALSNGFTKEQENEYAIFIDRLLNKYFWDDMTDRDVQYGLPISKDFFEE